MGANHAWAPRVGSPNQPIVADEPQGVTKGSLATGRCRCILFSVDCLKRNLARVESRRFRCSNSAIRFYRFCAHRPSPILACCVIVNIGMPGWFVAAGLGVMVKQPDSRGIPCFFVAIFSLATQFDVSPVGWCNRRMESLGRTGCTSASCISIEVHRPRRSHPLVFFRLGGPPHGIRFSVTLAIKNRQPMTVA